MTGTSSGWETFLVGQVLGGYKVDACVGGGNFGLVFEVTNVKTGSHFAMKVLIPNSDAGATADFDSEGVLLGKLNKCSNVINLIESGTASIQVQVSNGPSAPLLFKYHVLSLASGALEEVLVDPVHRNSVPWLERLTHWRGAIKGVHQMHLNTVAHRDLKSSNCLLMLRGGETEVRIADLGRSKDFSNPASLQLQDYLSGRGDRRFAPPEYLWLQGGDTEKDFRNADLYGLGSLFVELATGQPMTALAIGNWASAFKQGHLDYQAGTHRDLATLRPQFRRAAQEIADELPAVIRHEAVTLVRQLCDPVPAERQPRRFPGRRVVPDDGLSWLLRRADILSRRLSVEIRIPSYKTLKNKNRSA